MGVNRSVDKLDMRRKASIDVKALRESRGWLQKDTAARLGVSRAHLSALEHHKKGLSVNMMDAIIRVFGVTYEDFFSDGMVKNK